ncbi:MAG: RuBisCO large subunit C-terminal-like domain-containing protein [Pseudomonadota bacterium]
MRESRESTLDFCGERFSVAYSLAGPEERARALADDICIEQTVEFPEDLIEGEEIRKKIFGRVESFGPPEAGGARQGEETFEAVISYAAEISGHELTQLMNVMFGNASLKPGIRVEKIWVGPGLAKALGGPRFGRRGLRRLVGAAGRVLLCTALKPMGLSVLELAGQARRFALGGMDIIKDDHGLADQSFSRFGERVERCVWEVSRANRATSGRCLYVPNITAGGSRMKERALLAKQAGAGGLLVAPGLAGYGALAELAADDEIGLPILCHPAFQGSFVADTGSGLSHGMLFGKLARLAGADATIFPNYGGRFSFNREQCRQIVDATEADMGEGIEPIFPCPAGGMNMKNIPEMLEFYGEEAIFLMGGGLIRHGRDLVESCRYLRDLVTTGG